MLASAIPRGRYCSVGESSMAKTNWRARPIAREPLKEDAEARLGDRQGLASTLPSRQ